ncbi:MAG: response regulator [Geobacter sp.]|jgi:signal transduction histidine kinase|nr:response regulator [Geobacter sp.]
MHDHAPIPRLLFVDDDPGVLAAVKRFLRRYRYEVTTAPDGPTGLQIMREQGPFHLVVSDYQMPAMTGDRFLAQVAELTPVTRRMIMSAYADSEQLLAAINAGKVHRYLVKPWDSQELLAAIDDLLADYDQLTQQGQLADVSLDLKERLDDHAARLEAQGRQLQESNHRLRLLASHLEIVRDEERSRLARDIHDDLGQTLTAINLRIAAMLQSGPDLDPRPGLRELKNEIDRAIDTVQRVISAMRPQVLEELGLEAAFEGLAREARTRGGLDCKLTWDLQDRTLSPEIVTCLYRVAQEATTNVLRHAEADKLLISLRCHHGWCRLQIADNGAGITDAQAQAHNSFGLMGMRERVTRCGGSFSISQREGGGTLVEVQVPEQYEEAVA